MHKQSIFFQLLLIRNLQYSETLRKKYRKTLLSWYYKNQRKLPWRQNPTLYKTVISEFMLQQTRVSTVIPYFENWIKDFPSFASLAQASTENILKRWEGLGYYSRARNLHKLAKQLQSVPQIPRTLDQWLSFSGIGPYTGAAITSITYDHPIACLDGNVVRILSRIYDIDQEFKTSTEAAKKLTPIANQLLDKDHPGDYNQATMELGATVCSKQKPVCNLCPVHSFCAIKDRKNPENIPRFSKKKIKKIDKKRIFWVTKQKILLNQGDAKEKRLALIRELPDADEIGISCKNLPLLLKGKRTISNQKIEESIYRLDFNDDHLVNLLNTKNLEWVPLQEINRVTLSGPHRKWVQKIIANR